MFFFRSPAPAPVPPLSFRSLTSCKHFKSHSRYKMKANVLQNYFCTFYNSIYDFVCKYGPNIWTGQKGLKVYEEIHQNDYNRLVHVVFPMMPFFPFNRLPYYVSIIGILMMYTIYYASFDPEGAFYAFLFNLPSATLAGCHIYQYSPKNSIKVGLSTMLFSLTVQELLGHFYFEEVKSRLTVSYVFNAIMYAPLFHAKDLVENLPPMLMTTATIVFFTFFIYLLNSEASESSSPPEPEEE